MKGGHMTEDDGEYERLDLYFEALSGLRRMDKDELIIIIERLSMQVCAIKQAMREAGVPTIIQAPFVACVLDDARQERVDAMRYAASLKCDRGGSA